MAQHTLAAAPRTITGKKVSQLRREGKTPANVYGAGREPATLEVDTHETDLLLRRIGRKGSLALAIDGQPAVNVRIGEVQRKPTNDQLLHIDFIVDA